MVFWKRELEALSNSDKDFRSIYRIMTEFFSDGVFAERVVGGLTQRITYSQLFLSVSAAAAALHSRYSGKEGGFIAISMENSPEWVYSFFGILKAGFKPVLINTRLDSASIDYVLNETKPVCVLCDEANYRTGGVLFSSLETSGELSDDYWENEIALLTSGTTGNPKIIIYDGAAISAQVRVTTDIVGKSPSVANKYKNYDIRLVAFLPFYHIFGLITVLLWFGFFGRTLIFLNGYDSESIRFACIYNKASHFFAVPLVWNTVAASIFAEAKKTGQLEKLNKAVDISNKLQTIFPAFGRFVARKIFFKDVRKKALGETLTFCISGGGFVRPDTLRLLNGLGYSLHNGYGMTEAGICSVELSERADKRLEPSVGIPFETIEQVVSDDGLLYITGDTLYTAQIIDGKRVERDRSVPYCTNDMFEVMPDGRWHILGRRDDIIIGAGGENLSPDSIESQLRCPIPFCVVGLPNDDGTDTTSLVIQLGKDSTDFEKMNALKTVFDSIDALPMTQRPQAVYTIYDEIPTTLGKPKRAQLKQLIKDGKIEHKRAARPDASEVEQSYSETARALCGEIRGIFAEMLNTDMAITDSTHLIYDLAADSLTYYNIVAAVSNKYGVDLALDSDHPMMTAADFAARVLSARSEKQ